MSLSVGLPVLWDAPFRSADDDDAPEPTPVGAFRLSLAEEHLDEVGALYYQRAFLHDAPEAGLHDVAVCEQRLLSRADALAMGGAQAVDLAVEFLAKDDPADVFAGGFVLGMVRGPESIARIRAAWETIEDEALLSALADACHLAPHGEMAACLAERLDDPRALVREQALGALGARWDLTVPMLRKALDDDDAIVRQRAAALSAQGDESLVPALARDLHHDSPLVQVAAAGGLLRLGRVEGLEFCRWRLGEAGDDPATHGTAVLLGMAGSREDIVRLEEAWAASGGSVELALAFGLLGNVRASRTLVQGLQHPEPRIVEECAASLERISGAGLFAEADRAADLDFEEDEEPAASDRDEEPESDAAPGLSFDAWYAYWREALPRYEREVRYRRGRPVGPSGLIAELTTPGLPSAERLRTFDELVLRSGNRSPFHPGDFVPRQEERLTAWRTWAVRNEAALPAGAWTFTGRAL